MQLQKKEKEVESIWDTYKRELCSRCKNRKTDLCEIRRCIDGTYKCIYYERGKE